ncbi:NAD(P)-dependent oxidoreductase [Geitlerinema sp. P-1104]|uniref:NAD-dependent epimerase/dehydratase family protein n=1 Tax=Geitlerinema sp. P-1104 TaxID=2546230 RepID=UPI0014775E9E|nr:NAD(P)-dependent oxidoreductase [Geitlerinema sp. P-1104]NMG58874.1 NAD(P)-dependent oxidoreductase [Geitlerinema sp. P-1104]
MKRVLLTGASGCIGHYIAETLIAHSDCELYLFVRDRQKLNLDLERRSGIHVLEGDLREIHQFKEVLETINCAILAAAAWGGSRETFDINVTKTCMLMHLLNSEQCEQVIYFSTASILDRNGEILRAAAHMGTDYIRSKYDCLNQLHRMPIANRLTVLFPTIVLGGDENKPYSHVSAGLPEVSKWLNLARFISVEGSFHFIHAQDIAEVVQHLLENPPSERRHYVLGTEPYTVDRAVSELCRYFNKRVYFRLRLNRWLTDVMVECLVRLGVVQMAAWDRFCLEYRDFTYTDAVTGQDFDCPVHYPTLTDALKERGLGQHSQPKASLPSPAAPED